MKKVYIILLLILLLAGLLRFYGLTSHDVINDEVFYGYRSLGLIDSLNSPFQPTPYEWYHEDIPFWAKLSFHDHPPLGFWIQNVFFKIAGSNLLAMRLPFALAGVGSVFLVFLIAKLLFKPDKPDESRNTNPNPDVYHRLVSDTPFIPLVSAAVLAVSGYHVWISRIGLQESLVIFFILLTIYFFLKYVTPTQSPPYQGGDKEGVYFYLMVASIGVAILMKLTAMFLIPVFLIWLVWKRRDLLSWKRMLISAGILLLILSPVIIYNIGLYQARGHFDFQLSYLLGQDVPEWQVRPGRVETGLTTRVQDLFIRYWQNAGPVFSILTILAFIAATFSYIRNSITFARLAKDASRGRVIRSSLQFLILNLIFLILLLLFIGPQERFLSMFIPFIALLIPAGAVSLIESFPRRRESRIHIKDYRLWIIFIFLLAETAFTINTYLLTQPKGTEGLHYSFLRRDHESYGYNELENYLDQELSGFYPEKTLDLRFTWADQLQQEAVEAARDKALAPRAVLFVTDSTIHGMSNLWYITRRTVYSGWPMISDQAYLRATAEDPDFFFRSGFQKVVFIRAGDTLRRTDQPAEPGRELENTLIEQGIEPEIIVSPKGKQAFAIYKF